MSEHQDDLSKRVRQAVESRFGRSLSGIRYFTGWPPGVRTPDWQLPAAVQEAFSNILGPGPLWVQDWPPESHAAGLLRIVIQDGLPDQHYILLLCKFLAVSTLRVYSIGARDYRGFDVDYYQPPVAKWQEMASCNVRALRAPLSEIVSRYGYQFEQWEHPAFHQLLPDGLFRRRKAWDYLFLIGIEDEKESNTFEGWEEGP